MSSKVRVIPKSSYDESALLELLPDDIFQSIQPGDTVILKPNWVMESHKYRPDDWEYVITHPVIITAVLQKVLKHLDGKGQVIVTDGPTTEASFRKLIARYPLAAWQKLAKTAGVGLEIVDLREHEWETSNDVVVKRYRLPGDPRGKTEVDLLDSASEFWRHRKSQRGYNGADYDNTETNRAHDGHHNLYRVSRTVIEGDVFINLPKLKTHRKAGITCCLKNLVGINTYKNYLPHHSEGGPSEGGDQFPTDNAHARIEGPIMRFLKQNVLKSAPMARMLSPFNSIGRMVFGDTRDVIRSGNWHGNDTIWRMILDLNKVLLYANPDGSMREGVKKNAKRYIGIVDAVLAGEGHGPLAPEPVHMGYIFCGTNPVAIDAVCATFMGFDPLKIPAIANSFRIRSYPLCDFSDADIRAVLADVEFSLEALPEKYVIPFEPQFGWKGHIERGKLQYALENPTS
ncbi:MAG TPA: DUF362 domain-containing protein [Nitrospirota bacterium]|nr:DUF362 domain-containing protein [Nitrospirota bacterium]